MKNILFFIVLSLVLNSWADEYYVTVYNQNLALIKHIREVEIRPENLPLKFTDVAAKLIPTSVHLRPLKGSAQFTLLEQNFEYDLVSADQILRKYIDHPVEIVAESGTLISGTLLSYYGSNLIVRTNQGIKILPWNDRLSITVKDLPEGLITRPTLVWELGNIKSGKAVLEVSYLTEGMQWHAEYVGVLNEKSNQLDLGAWVSIDNKSGATYKDARLKLVAGEIHRASKSRLTYYRMAEKAVDMAKAAPAFQEREIFEYHIYELDRKTTLKNNQKKQITLFPNTVVSCWKELYYNASMDPKKVEVRIIFKNTKEAGLGQPLPAGIVRLYQKDRESLEFVGEDRIDHTPRNEEVKLVIGKAFDVTAERRIIDKKKISKRSERQRIEIELKNNKKEDIKIRVEEFLYYPNWEISDNNFSYTKKDAQRIEFWVPVKADGKTIIQYTVTYSW